MSERNLAGWVWMLPLVFVLHDGEEILTMEAFLCGHAERLPSQLTKIASLSTGQFTLSVLLLLVLILVFGFLAYRAHYSGLPMTLFALLTAILFGNGLTHLGQAAALRSYTPGLLTAPIVIGFTFLALRGFWKQGFVTRRNLLPLLAGGLLLQLPLITVALAFGRMFNL